MVLSPPASCHQEIGNAADEDTPSGKRSNDDSSHNPSTHRQVGNRQLLRLFWGMRERERGPCDALEGLPTTLPTVSVRVHTLMCESIFPARSFLLYFRSDHPTVRLILPLGKVNMSQMEHPGSPHLNISASLGFPSNLSTSHTYLLTRCPTLAPPTGFFLPQLMPLCPSRKRMRFWTAFYQGYKGLIGFSSSTCQIWDQALPDSSPLQQNL